MGALASPLLACLHGKYCRSMYNWFCFISDSSLGWTMSSQYFRINLVQNSICVWPTLHTSPLTWSGYIKRKAQVFWKVLRSAWKSLKDSKYFVGCDQSTLSDLYSLELIKSFWSRILPMIAVFYHLRHEFVYWLIESKICFIHAIPWHPVYETLHFRQCL